MLKHGRCINFILFTRTKDAEIQIGSKYFPFGSHWWVLALLNHSGHRGHP